MREFSRKDRLADQIKREVADIVQNVLKDPNLGFVTITDAELSGDLRLAKVFYSVLGDADAKRTSGKTLARSIGVIQSQLARRLKVRNVPLLSFHPDTSAEYGSHMDQIFKQIEAERQDENGESSEENAG
jgi:ribosome-binding factor A